jgi:DNA-binding transcriptional regulator YiaG
MNDETLTPAGSEIVGALTEFYDTLRAGGEEAVAKRYTIRDVKLDLKPSRYTGEEVRKVRNSLNASQALLAKYLGVGVTTVRSWESGAKKPSNMACRFLDEITSRPEIFEKRIKDAIVAKAKENGSDHRTKCGAS